MRSLDLKQKVLGTADNESDVPYDENIVNSMFLHALSTGLRDDSIRHQLRGVLVKGVTDVEILQALDRIALTENEHNQKVHTKLRVQSIEVPHDPQIEKLKGEIDVLREQLAQIAKPAPEPMAPRPRGEFRPPRRSGGNYPKKCVPCRNTNRWCNHCFKCGSSEHFQRDCRAETLNGQRSLVSGKQ